MLTFNIESTKDTPAIIFSSEKKQLSITGYSYPENAAEFYKPLLKTIDEVISSLTANESFTLNIQLLYFNSSSSKIFIDIFDKLEEVAETGKNIEVNWIYDAENESMKEYGDEFKEDLQFVNFNFKELQ